MFELGRLVATQGVLAVVFKEDMELALDRYTLGDWGDICEEDKQLNDYALVNGERLMGVYTTGGGVTFWIITEWDRSVTTLLLPHEY